MDHKNMEYFQKSQKLNRRQARWSLYLSRFDFALFHQPGHLMGRPDALSRCLDHRVGSKNSDVTLLWPELFRLHTMEGIAVPTEYQCPHCNPKDSTHPSLRFYNLSSNEAQGITEGVNRKRDGKRSKFIAGESEAEAG
jgi:hypothetical protein